MTAQRALILLRLSRMTDATTSPERQRADCEAFCEREGMTVVGIAEDWDVSGSTDPLERSGSGPWLRDRLSEFDVIVSQKLDRVGRNARHMSALMNYLSDAGKNLRCALDSTNIGDAIGRMIVYVMATVAEMELSNISARNANAAQHNIKAGKYRGGTTPAGYCKVKDAKGEWRLTPDEEGTAPAIREIVSRTIAGERMAAIVQDLNARQVPTHKDVQDARAGRTPDGRGWSLSNVRRMLLSPAILGYVVTGPEQTIMRDDSGEPISRTDAPVISPSDYYAVRAILEQRSEDAPKQKKSAESPLLSRVITCGVCGKPMDRLKGGEGRKSRYRCRSASSNGAVCGNGSAVQDNADEVITDYMMTLFGNRMMFRREWIAGNDHSMQIADLDRELEAVLDAVGRVPVGTPAHDRTMARIESISANRSRLAAQPVQESGYRYVPSGELFGEAWQAWTVAERNDFLRNHGIGLTFTREGGRGQAHYDIEPGNVAAILDSIEPAS